MMQTMLRIVFYVSAAIGLASCASTGDFSAADLQPPSFSVNGLGWQGMDLRDPRFYMDDDQQMAPIARDPRCC